MFNAQNDKNKTINDSTMHRKTRCKINKMAFPKDRRFKTRCWDEINEINYRNDVLLEKLLQCIMSVKKGEQIIIPTKQETTRRNPMDNIVYQDEIDLQLDPGTGNTTALFGASKSGKSTLISHIFDKYYNHDEIVSTLFTDSPQNKILLGKDDLLLCNNFGKSAAKIIQAQKYFNTKSENMYEFINILDDIVNISYNNTVNKSILIFRNSLISSLISLQYCKLLSVRARSNVNNVMFLSLNTDESIEQAIKLFLKSHFRKMGLNTLNQMIDYYREVTSNHAIIYIRPSDRNFIKFIRLDLNKPINQVLPIGYSDRLEKRLQKELGNKSNSIRSINDLISSMNSKNISGQIDRMFITKTKPDLNMLREYFSVQLKSINSDNDKNIFS